MTVSSIDAPIVLREQIEADGSISRVEVWLSTDGNESQHQLVSSETDSRLSWGGTLRHGYDINGELVRLVVDGLEADPVASPAEAVRLLAAVLDQFDYWTGEPRPAIDGGTVRLHNFREVQPPMEKVLAEARRFLEGAVATLAPLDVERLARALHVSAPETHHRRKCIDRHDLRAADIAAEYARLEGQLGAEEPT